MRGRQLLYVAALGCFLSAACGGKVKNGGDAPGDGSGGDTSGGDSGGTAVGIEDLVVAPSAARATDSITITFRLTGSTTATPDVTVASLSATLVAENSLSYQYDYVVAGTEAEGDATVEVSVPDGIGGTATASTTVALDFTPPGVLNLGASPNPAVVNDVLTISFDVSEPLAADPTVTVNGASATIDSASGLTYGYHYTVDSADQQGTAQIAVTATDFVGNVGNGSATTELVIDPAVPVFLSIQATPDPARSGTKLTITFTASVALSGDPTVTVAGNPATFVQEASLQYEYEYWVLGSEQESSVAIVVTGQAATGGAGTSSGSVTLDFTPPEVAGIQIAPDPAGVGQQLAIGFDVNEPLASNPLVSVDGLPASYASFADPRYGYAYDVGGGESSGSVEVRIEVGDLAGNGQVALASVTLTTPPWVTATLPPAGSVGVELDTRFRVFFSRAINASTLDSTTLSVSGATGVISYDAALRLATFIPSAPLTPATTYTVALTSGIEAADGVALVDQSWQVTTRPATGAVISGTVALPPTWTAPKLVEAQSGAWTVLAGDDYSITVDARPDNQIFAWDDLDGDDTWDTGEPRLFHFDCRTGTGVIDTSTRSQNGRDIRHRVLRGTAAYASAWTNPRALEPTTGNTTSIDATGGFTFDLALGDFEWLTVFEDLDADGQLDAGAETSIVHEIWGGNLCFDVRPLRLHYPLVTGSTANLPAGWNAKVVVVYNDYRTRTETQLTVVPIDVGGTYVADAGATFSRAYVFDDIDGDDVWDEGLEGRIEGSPATLGAADGERVIDVTGRAVSGTAAPPNAWTNPMIAAIGYADITDLAISLPAGAGAQAYTIDTGANRIDLAMFDDLNANGVLDFDEPWTGPNVLIVDTLLSDVSGIDFNVAEVSGTITGVPSWSQPTVLVDGRNGWATTSVSGGAYTLYITQDDTIELLLFDDANADGQLGPGEPLVHLADGPTSGPGPFVLDATVCTISGTATPPPEWANPGVGAESKPGVPRWSSGTLTGGAYTAHFIVGSGYDLVLFDDQNGDGTYSDKEPKFPVGFAGASSACPSASGPALVPNSISGYAAAPPSWAAPKVCTDSWDDEYNFTAVDPSTGSYTLYVSDDDHDLYLVDASGVGRDCRRTEPQIPYTSNPVASAANPTGIDFSYVTISGRISPPPAWTNPTVGDVGAGQNYGGSASPDAGGRYVLFVGPTDDVVVTMFDDWNYNGRFDTNEANILYDQNYVDTTGGDVEGVNIGFVWVSGTALPPPGWSPVGVNTGESWQGVSADVAGNFVLPVGRSPQELAMFMDWDRSGIATGMKLRYGLGPVDTTRGSVSGITIDHAVVRGTVNVYSSWTNPTVVDPGSPQVVVSPDMVGQYELYVSRGPEVSLAVFEDADDDNYYYWMRPTLWYVGNPVNTLPGVIEGVDFTISYVRGTVQPFSDWTNPKVVDTQVPTMSVSPDSSGVYALPVSPSASTTLAVFEDPADQGEWDSFFSPTLYYLNNPLDTRGGDANGIDFGFTTISGTIVLPAGWTTPRAGLAEGFMFDVAHDTAVAGTSFTVEAGYELSTVVMYDDVNGNGVFGFGEPAFQYCPGGTLAQVDTTGGPVTGIVIDDTCSWPF